MRADWIPAVVVGFALSVLSACDGGEAVAKAVPEQGYATGRVVDTRGDPIHRARVYLDNTLFTNSFIESFTAEDGRYRAQVYPGAWRASATFRKDYNGRTYTLRLRPDATDSFDHEGAVRNFTWQLEGRWPDNDAGFYGGNIHVSSEVHFAADMADVEVVLTPDGPLIDGSAGKPLRLRLDDHYWRNLFQIADIPIGRYTVTASLRSDDGTSRPLTVRNWHGDHEPAPEFQLEFIPEHGSTPGASAAVVIGD